VKKTTVYPQCITPFPCPFSVLAVALFNYYASVPVETEVKYVNNDMI